MGPEFIRIQNMHGHELNEMNLKFDTQERDLQKNITIRYQQKVDDARKEIAFQTQNVLHDIYQEHTTALEGIESDSKHQILSLHQEAKHNLETLQLDLQKRNQKILADLESEYKRFQETHHQCLGVKKGNFEKDLAILMKDTEQQVRFYLFHTL